MWRQGVHLPLCGSGNNPDSGLMTSGDSSGVWTDEVEAEAGEEAFTEYDGDVASDPMIPPGLLDVHHLLLLFFSRTLLHSPLDG